jgi:CobQ-like glutamine amidotransferase family enzyme
VGEFVGEDAGADAADLVEDAELGQGDVEQHVVAEAGPPPGPSERQQIMTTAAIGVGVVAFVGAAIILGKKLWSSQGPKVQKVGIQLTRSNNVERLAYDWGVGDWNCAHMVITKLDACAAVRRGEAAAA